MLINIVAHIACFYCTCHVLQLLSVCLLCSENQTLIRKWTFFTNVHSMLRENEYKIYDHPKHWHNIFRKYLLNTIDEELFGSLFDNSTGATNYPDSNQLHASKSRSSRLIVCTSTWTVNYL